MSQHFQRLATIQSLDKRVNVSDSHLSEAFLLLYDEEISAIKACRMLIKKLENYPNALELSLEIVAAYLSAKDALGKVKEWQ